MHYSPHVLVIDDDPVFLSLMGAYLSRLHCNSFLIQDSRQALQFLSDNDVDFCFMDIVMPNIGGVELVRVIRQDLKKTFPIIAVSAFYMTVEADRCREAGMSDVLQKPVCFEDVERILAEYRKQSPDRKE
jgi:CheY-like chemotaxis protein